MLYIVLPMRHGFTDNDISLNLSLREKSLLRCCIMTIGYIIREKETDSGAETTASFILPMCCFGTSFDDKFSFK